MQLTCQKEVISFVCNLLKDKVIRQTSISRRSLRVEVTTALRHPGTHRSGSRGKQRKSCWVRSGGRQIRNSVFGARFENRTAEHKEQPCPASPSFDTTIRALLRFRHFTVFRALFSLRPNWVLCCTAGDCVPIERMRR